MAAITGFSGVVKAVTSGGTLAAVSELKSWSVESIDLEFYPGGTGASTKWAGTAIVTGTSSSGDSGDLVGSSITFQGTGALTVTA